MRELLIDIYNSFESDSVLTTRRLICIINDNKKSELILLSEDEIIDAFYMICGDIEDCFTLYDYIHLLFNIILPVKHLRFTTNDLIWLIEDVIYREKSIIKYNIFNELSELEKLWDGSDFSLTDYIRDRDTIEQFLSDEKVYGFRDYYNNILKLERQLLLLR